MGDTTTGRDQVLEERKNQSGVMLALLSQHQQHDADDERDAGLSAIL
jgi:hypothetical protein